MNNAPRLSVSRRLRKTPFTSRTIARGASAFTVYNHMLLATEFVSVQEDYWHLCSAVQVWDVGVERQVSIEGPDANRLVQWMTPRDISTVALDRCIYLPLADENGKLVNDPIGIRLAEDHWWLSIADSDVILWAKGLATGAGLDVVVTEPDVWPLAVQGPHADTLMERVFGPATRDIRFFRYVRLPYKNHTLLVARSGWSKQGGFEIYVDDSKVGQTLYDELFDKGADLNVKPGCPNLIERLESGLLSYGNDMDARHSVIESGLAGFVSLDADIDAMSIKALREERDAGPARRLMGLILPAPDGPRMLAEDLFLSDFHGDLTSDETPSDIIPNKGDLSHCLGSQCWSPRYRCQLATAMLEEPLAGNDELDVYLANRETVKARVCALPFDFVKLGLSPTVQ